jgi:hypothetical protein
VGGFEFWEWIRAMAAKFNPLHLEVSAKDMKKEAVASLVRQAVAATQW